MKRSLGKKECLLAVAAALLFCAVVGLSVFSVRQLRGNARVVNYVGVVRGATQKLVMQELTGRPDDELIARLDAIISELVTGEGPYDLPVLQDDAYLEYLVQIQRGWGEIKAEIVRVRAGGSSQTLYQLSEDYYMLANETVAVAEQYSEKQVRRVSGVLIVADVSLLAFMVCALVGMARISSLQQRIGELDEMAYTDSLTRLDNRASCERYTDRLKAQAPAADIGVFMFDMSNLKAVNERLGRPGGDSVIADFARVLKDSAGDDAFVARYDGGAFVVISVGISERGAQEFLVRVNDRIVSRNLEHIDDIRRMSFAVGYHIGNLRDKSVGDMIEEADRGMRTRKKEMKETGL